MCCAKPWKSVDSGLNKRMQIFYVSESYGDKALFWLVFDTVTVNLAY